MPSRTRVLAAAMGAAAAGLPSGVIASTYIVHPGDTLADIAVRHATTVEALAIANELADPATIRVGQLLQIPDAHLALPAYTITAERSDSYTVATGDTLVGIARRHGIDLTALARANGINVNSPLPAGVVLQVPGRLGRMNALLTHGAESVGVDADLVRAVAWTESAWRQAVVSPTGAVGLMQIEPSTGEWVSEHLAGSRLDLHLAGDNVRAGALLLRHLSGVHDGDVAAALAAYYQGDASISRNGLHDDTRRYVSVVSSLMSGS